MSFFYDFLECFNLKDLTGKVAVSFVLGEGLIVVGKIKVLKFSDELIELKAEKYKLLICGKLLKISSMGKGEIVVSGDVDAFKVE